MSKAPERIQQAINNLASDGPSGRRYRIQTQGRAGSGASFTVTLLKRACREHGISAERPGEVEEYYFADKGFIAIDLNPEKTHE